MNRFDPGLLPPAPDLKFEQGFWACDLLHVAGIDEAGRGSLAGPVVAGVVIFQPDKSLMDSMNGVRDSKQMTPENRRVWALRIKSSSAAWGVAKASQEEIDQLGIVPATRLAVHRALQACRFNPDHLLLDYLFLPDIDIPQTKLVKGDQRSLSVAAASVLAKTARDSQMVDLDKKYPGYHLAENKGYGTSSHLEAIARLGPSPIHRKTFAPMKASA